MSKANDTKSAALGMPIGTASNRLRKMILFSLVCRLKMNTCHQCGTEILSVDDLSIEHREPWLQADDPVQSFFDLDNITFSHLSCNSGAASNPRKKYFTEEEKQSAQAGHQRKWRETSCKEKQRKVRRDKYLRLGT